ncbi:hypothetical protein [Methyloversatilis discipulorum]|uniref:hypothetical protein n=1 Tax=Methyloversatilis discipulorum TaxID=1119528 RepID=UPI001A4D6218|nr:hypothetical protein [Methyloversatilis discipulorum]MBL8466606.1 hypothetical protein [Methyloversatilis discipulorum]
MGRMVARTVRMDRVFDLHRLQDDHHRFTLFSFEAGGRSHFGIRTFGWPDIREGMTVTALVDEETGWNGLFGWFDHGAGVWYLPSIAMSVLHCAVALSAAGFFLIQGTAPEHGPMWHIGSAVMVILAVTTASALLSALINRRRLRAAVRALGLPARP